MDQEMKSAEPPAPPHSLPKYIRKGLPKQDRETLKEARDYIEELIQYTEQPVGDGKLPDDADPVDADEENRRGGTLVWEKVTCGDPTCKCIKKGEKHGPYLYRYYRKADGTLTSEYADNE